MRRTESNITSVSIAKIQPQLLVVLFRKRTMKLINLIALYLISVAAVVVAKSCKNGGVYCGQSLLNRGTSGKSPLSCPSGRCPWLTVPNHAGNYYNHIVAVLQENGKPTDEEDVLDSLFQCGSGGDIFYLTFCSHGCGGVGNIEPDYCI